MPQGQPLDRPRRRPDHPAAPQPAAAGRAHRRRKGKSTAAFGLALRGWNQGWSIGVFQFVKSAKWKVGEETAFRALGRLHDETGEGGPVEWHKMGEGWSWTRKAGHRGRPRRRGAPRAGRRSSRRIEAQTPRLLRARRVHLPDEVGLGRRRRGRRRARRRGRAASTSSSPAATRAPRAARGRRPGHRDDQGQAPDGRGPEGPAGHRVVTRRAAPRRMRRRARRRGQRARPRVADAG